MLLWLWHRLAAPAPIPLTWELSYAAGAALKKKKKRIVMECSLTNLIGRSLLHPKGYFGI